MITSQTAPLYLEQKVADTLGLSRPEIQHIRKTVLKKKKDWTILGRSVVLTKDALDRIMVYLRHSTNARIGEVDFADCQRAIVAPQKKESPNGFHQLTVLRIPPNPRVLSCTNDAGAIVVAQVQNNRNFRPKMTLAARLVRPGVYQMEGRCPRYPGRY